MTLEQATNAVLSAIEAEDLSALAQALEGRDQALAATPQPSRQALEAGDRACRALAGLKQRWAAENARLNQMQAGFAPDPPAQQPAVVVHG